MTQFTKLQDYQILVNGTKENVTRVGLSQQGFAPFGGGNPLGSGSTVDNITGIISDFAPLISGGIQSLQGTATPQAGMGTRSRGVHLIDASTGLNLGVISRKKALRMLSRTAKRTTTIHKHYDINENCFPRGRN